MKIWSRLSKDKTPLSVGDRVKEIGVRHQHIRIGEITLVREGRCRSFELIQLSPRNLEPIRRGDLGQFKRFRLSEERCIRLNKNKYANRRTFQIGDVIRSAFGRHVRYGIIVNFLHPDGLLPTSHENGYNGKDLLECIEISGKPGLFRKRDAVGHVQRFLGRPHRSKICKLLPPDEKSGLRIDSL